MEIIIHGKPNSDSSYSTSAIDSGLKDKITNYYFNKAKLSDSSTEMLAVELYNWQGNQYCVYNYVPADKIQDTSGRSSYFVITVIMQGQYFRQVSDLFFHIREVYKNVVSVNFNKRTFDEEKRYKGAYLLANGKYLDNSFTEETGLCSKILKEIDSKDFYYLTGNLEQNLNTRSFSDDTDFEVVSVKDCDSLDFMHILRERGRVIVCDTANTMRLQIAEMKKNNELLKRKKDAEINKLKQPKTKDNKTQESAVDVNVYHIADDLQNENNQLKETLRAVAEVLDKVKLQKPVLSDNPTYNIHPELKQRKIWKEVKRFRHVLYIPAAILVLVLGVISLAKGYPTSDSGNTAEQIKASKDSIKTLNDSITTLTNTVIPVLKDSITTLKNDADGNATEQQKKIEDLSKQLNDEKQKVTKLQKDVNDKTRQINSLYSQIDKLKKAGSGGKNTATTPPPPANSSPK